MSVTTKAWLVLLVLAALGACGCAVRDDPIVGDYVGKYVRPGNIPPQYMPPPSALNLHLSADHTYTAVTTGAQNLTTTGTWRREDNVIVLGGGSVSENGGPAKPLAEPQGEIKLDIGADGRTLTSEVGIDNSTGKGEFGRYVFSK